MLNHLVMWTFKPEANGKSAAENAAMIKERLLALRGRIPELKGISVSDVVLPTSTEQPTLVLLSRHDDAAGLAAYAAHPEHQEVAVLIKDLVSSRRAVDFIE